MKSSLTSWALVAALSGFLFGFDTAVISGAEQAVQEIWDMGDALHGLAISSALWGTVLGALLGGKISDRFGRKPTLIGIGILYLLSAIGSALAWDPTSFILFRLIGGLGVGASSVAAPAYISEIAPDKQRGRLVALFQTMIVVGVLIAFVSNYLIGKEIEDSWRIMLGAEVLPAVLFMSAVFFIPESPRWLALYGGDKVQALATLKKIDPVSAESTLAEIGDAQETSMSVRRFFSGSLRKPITLAFLLAFFNQVSGINAIIYYAPRIFELTGTPSLLATTGIGISNLVFTIVGLILIDKAGRKSLMLIGSIGYILSLSLVSYGFASENFALVPIFIFVFIAAHAVGQGAVIWVYISEIFPNNARGLGQSFGSSVHWVLAAALTLFMPLVLANVDAEYIFASFATMMVLQMFFVIFMMVETRGRSLENVAKEMVQSKG